MKSILDRKIDIKNNFPLKGLTTYKIGGQARYFVLVDSLTELKEVLFWAKANKISWFLLGAGSNILIPDEGFSGVVIKLGRWFNEIEINHKKKEVISGAAVMLTKLGKLLAASGWAGFEYMCGIPGTVGAAVKMNAGTRLEGEIKDSFIEALALTPSLELIRLKKKDMQFSYRSSRLAQEKHIVINVVFKLDRKNTKAVLQRKIQEIMLSRKRRQPTNIRNCGSVFRNPSLGKSAGWYIEQVGLKGVRVGDAAVADEHANWIVNLKNAKAKDIKRLIKIIQNKVSRKFGIKLEKELIYVPKH